MLKNTLIYLTVVLTTVTADTVAFATDLTPEKAVTIALTDNRDLVAARISIHQAEGRLKQAGLLPNPELEFSFKNDTFFANDGEYDFSTGFKQRFPITERLTHAKDVARVDVAMALAEVRNKERLLIGDVLSRSRELLITQEKLKVNREVQSIVRNLIEVSEKRLHAAEASAVDVNVSKLELQKLAISEAVIISQLEGSVVALNGLLGLEPNNGLQMTAPAMAEFDMNGITEISQQTANRRPDRQLAVLGIDRAAAEMELAHTEKWEDWTLGFDYSRSVGKFAEPIGTKTDSMLGVVVSIPLPLWNKNEGKISETQAVRQRAEADLSALDLRIATETQTAENQMRCLYSILRQYDDKSINLAAENIALLQKGYKEGLVNIASVVQAQQQYLDLRMNYLETMAGFQRALTDWQTATAYYSTLSSEK